MLNREPTPLERRVAATSELLESWRDRPFSWAKASTCGRLITDHLRRMGYKPPVARAGSYRSALAARRALARINCATVGDMLDGLGLQRIAPAAALVGDIVELPGEVPFGAMTVALGNGRVLGFHEDLPGAGVLQPQEYVAAWRVEPRT